MRTVDESTSPRRMSHYRIEKAYCRVPSEQLQKYFDQFNEQLQCVDVAVLPFNREVSSCHLSFSSAPRLVNIVQGSCTTRELRINHFMGKVSDLRGMPTEVLMNSYCISKDEARRLKLVLFAPKFERKAKSFGVMQWRVQGSDTQVGPFPSPFSSVLLSKSTRKLRNLSLSLSLSLTFRGPGNRDVELRRRRCGIRVPYVGLPSRINMLSGSHSEKGPRNGGRDGCGRTHLYLNVYDLTPINKYLYWFGLGIFHSGIEGAPSSRRNLGIWITRSVWLGTTDMSRSEFRILIEDFAGKYHGDTYNLIIKNCNHFTDELCMHLTGKPIPGWVNRLARLG
ncbi:hypothetical protein BHM03_00009041 [Ensete ventricosum]|nr:hypothetical protein BHM03_00009041 [Ensete ventricosum]